MTARMTCLCLCLAVCASATAQEFRRLPVSEYRNKMEGGWVGQMVGVAWGGPTEDKFRQIMPASKMPPFQDTLVNQAFRQDDLYVEMTFLRSLEQHGFGISQRQAGIDFVNSRYALAVANDAARKNLRAGIAPPDSGHPLFNPYPSAIDYQIESDYSGLIAPGLPNVAIRLGNTFGRLMNFGDGVYGGQFMGAMYAEAFFEKDIQKIIQAGLRCIPEESQYAEMVRDVLAWHRENPTDWQDTWRLIDRKYRSPKYWQCRIDVKLEGAYVLVGLLYGDRDPDKTILIATRCGDDSDCNPSSAAGVLGTSLGLSGLPRRYYEKLDKKKIFSYTNYNFPALVAVCEKLARQEIIQAGGRVEQDAEGNEVFVIPVKPPAPNAFENVRRPGPFVGSRFTAEEMKQIREVNPTPK